jgi:hypothetical protein
MQDMVHTDMALDTADILMLLELATLASVLLMPSLRLMHSTMVHMDLVSELIQLLYF